MVSDDHCDICGKKLTKNGYQHQIGLILDVTGGFEEKEFIALFGKSRVAACYCCFAKGVGFNIINK